MAAYDRISALLTDTDAIVSRLVAEHSSLRSQVGNPEESLSPEQVAAIQARIEGIKAAL